MCVELNATENRGRERNSLETAAQHRSRTVTVLFSSLFPHHRSLGPLRFVWFLHIRGSPTLPSYLISGTQSVVLGPAAWTLPRSLVEMQTPRLTLNQHFKQDPRVIHDHIQV